MSTEQRMNALLRVAHTANELMLLARSVSMHEFGWCAWELLAELKGRLADLHELEEEVAE